MTEDTILPALDPAASGRSDLVELQSELAGTLLGFLRSHQRRDGRYVLADIGGLTVDTVFSSIVKPPNGRSLFFPNPLNLSAPT